MLQKEFTILVNFFYYLLLNINEFQSITITYRLKFMIIVFYREKDVAAIDINMGCPKEFSIKGGMGVALMAKPEKALNILKTLVSNLSIPVTCKIRIFQTQEDTLELVEMLVSSGIKSIAIHGRTRDERPQHAVHTDIIRYVAENVSIPVIAK